MSSSIGDFSELATEIEEQYEEGTILDDWASRSVTGRIPSKDYYQGGKIVVDMPDNFLPPITASTYAGHLIDQEKHHIFTEIKNSAENEEIPVNPMPDYSHDGLLRGFAGVRSPTHLFLPTEQGRPKRLHDELNKTTTVPYGASEVDVEFVSSRQFDIECGIAINAGRISVYQVEAGDLEYPNNISVAEDLSGSGHLVQMAIGESTVPDAHDFLYRTVYSELDGLSDNAACVIDLPD